MNIWLSYYVKNTLRWILNYFIIYTLMKTPVVFKILDWNVIALFPEMKMGRYIWSYQHIWQHSEASPDLLVKLPWADKHEYADLKLELEWKWYELDIRDWWKTISQINSEINNLTEMLWIHMVNCWSCLHCHNQEDIKYKEWDKELLKCSSCWFIWDYSDFPDYFS